MSESYTANYNENTIYTTDKMCDVGFDSYIGVGGVVDVRIARYPDGSLRVQGAYVQLRGVARGVEWKDLRIVDVDDDGIEIKE